MTKEQERDELHRTIWQIANDLRGSVDVWGFKSYVLGILFYRFISENLTSFLNKEEQRAGNTSFNYLKISDNDVELYQSSKSNISEHIKHIFEEGELNEELVVRKFRTTATDGKDYNTTYLSKSNVVVLDIEVTFQSIDGPTKHDRIDILLYNKRKKSLQFVEAKHYTNKELWSTYVPSVIGQIQRDGRLKNQIIDADAYEGIKIYPIGNINKFNPGNI